MKVSDLQEYVTVPEAAKQISKILLQDITEAHVYRYALDGHLKLSVNFVNVTIARRTRNVQPPDLEWNIFIKPKSSTEDLVKLFPDKYMEFPPENLEKWKETRDDVRDNFIPILVRLDKNGKPSHNGRFLTKDPGLYEINGIWDLPMFGDERLDIEHKYQQLTNGPVVTLSSAYGAYVEDNEGELFQLQVQEFDDQYIKLTESKPKLRELKEHIVNNKINRLEAQELLDKHNREWGLGPEDSFIPMNHLLNYYTSHTLPEDCVLVVRTSALRNFEQLINDKPTSTETPAQRSERLKKRVIEEKTKGTKAFLRTVAQEENISISRLKQIISEISTDNSRWGDLLNSKRQTSSKNKYPKY